MDNELRIDVGTRGSSVKPWPPGTALLGGRALSARLLLQNVDPTCHPLGPASKLVFVCGLLCGTAVTTSGRLSVGGKSPLTGGIKEANVGGTAGHKLARLGYRHLILEGQPSSDEWQIVHINGEGVRFEPAGDLVGLGTYESTARLMEGSRSKGVVCIGPAGEHRLSAASIAVSDVDARPTRHAARGGLGAVMGAKRVKAIVVDDAGSKPLAALDPELFKRDNVAFSKEVLEDPRVHNMSAYGTAGVVGYVNRPNVQSLPTRNHHRGTFEHADAISGKTIAAMHADRHGKMMPCMPGCIVKCAIYYNDQWGHHLTSALEFETIALIGSNLEIGDIDAIARLDRLCDDIGLDTIETGSALGVAADAGVFDFGDHQRTAELLEEIRRGTPLGRIIGSGTVVVAQVFGIDRVPAVKGQGLPAWEPRTLKGMGVTYATSPMGADHTAGMAMGRGISPETALKQSQYQQMLMAATDSVGLCQFVNATEEQMAKLLNARFGLSLTGRDVLDMGRTCLLDEQSFNHAAGLGPETDRLPEWLRTEAFELPDGPSAFDVPDELLDRFFETLEEAIPAT